MKLGWGSEELNLFAEVRQSEAVVLPDQREEGHREGGLADQREGEGPKRVHPTADHQEEGAAAARRPSEGVQSLQSAHQEVAASGVVGPAAGAACARRGVEVRQAARVKATEGARERQAEDQAAVECR